MSLESSNIHLIPLTFDCAVTGAWHPLIAMLKVRFLSSLTAAKMAPDPMFFEQARAKHDPIFHFWHHGLAARTTIRSKQGLWGWLQRWARGELRIHRLVVRRGEASCTLQLSEASQYVPQLARLVSRGSPSCHSTSDVVSVTWKMPYFGSKNRFLT